MISSTGAPARVRAGALCWLITLAWFVMQPVVAAGWPRPYSYRDNAVSDLGAIRCGPVAAVAGAPARDVCSPWHLGWDATFVGCGLLIIVGALLLRPIWSPRASGTVGTVLLVVSGLGLVTVGLVPEDVSATVHGLAAAVHIPAQGIALLVLGVGLARARRPLAGWTLVCAVLALAGTVVFFSPVGSGLGYGLSERLALAPFMAWVVVVGLTRLVGRGRRGPEQPSR